MTQKVFDVHSDKDLEELFDILPDRIDKINKVDLSNSYNLNAGISWLANDGSFIPQDLFNINWYDETVIYRPIKEATSKDIGKLCIFWNKESDLPHYARLFEIKDVKPREYVSVNDDNTYLHCRKLTQKEWEELR